MVQSHLDVYKKESHQISLRSSLLYPLCHSGYSINSTLLQSESHVSVVLETVSLVQVHNHVDYDLLAHFAQTVQEAIKNYDHTAGAAVE